jgi:hypothetical protein
MRHAMSGLSNRFDPGYNPEFDDGFAAVILNDLHASKISVSIVWVLGGEIAVELGDLENGVVAKRIFPAGIVEVTEWLRDQACERYPNSAFTQKYGPRPVTIPGSPEARALGCICPSDQTGSTLYRVHIECPAPH